MNKLIEKDYVWYASYGSNINKERFLCYIRGGTPKGSSKEERGCRDHSLPIDEKTFIIPHQLYFAKESVRWNGGGVAFIGLERDESQKTYSKMYLVTREQFLDVVSQENNLERFDIDLKEVIEKGNKIFKDAWYGNLLYISNNEGYPIFTFTSPNEAKTSEFRKPSIEYLSTIIFGLKTQMGLSDDQLVDYFSQVPGITGNFSIEELRNIVEGT